MSPSPPTWPTSFSGCFFFWCRLLWPQYIRRGTFFVSRKGIFSNAFLFLPRDMSVRLLDLPAALPQTSHIAFKSSPPHHPFHSSPALNRYWDTAAMVSFSSPSPTPRPPPFSPCLWPLIAPLSFSIFPCSALSSSSQLSARFSETRPLYLLIISLTLM